MDVCELCLFGHAVSCARLLDFILLLGLRSMMFNRLPTSFFCFFVFFLFLFFIRFSLTVDIEIMPRHCKDKTNVCFFSLSVYYYILLLLILLFALFRHTIQMIEFYCARITRMKERKEWRGGSEVEEEEKSFIKSAGCIVSYIFARNIV